MQRAATNWWSIGDDINAYTIDVEGVWGVKGCRKGVFVFLSKLEIFHLDSEASLETFDRAGRNMIKMMRTIIMTMIMIMMMMMRLATGKMMTMMIMMMVVGTIVITVMMAMMAMMMRMGAGKMMTMMMVVAGTMMTMMTTMTTMTTMTMLVTMVTLPSIVCSLPLLFSPPQWAWNWYRSALFTHQYHHNLIWGL